MWQIFFPSKNFLKIMHWIILYTDFPNFNSKISVFSPKKNKIYCFPTWFLGKLNYKIAFLTVILIIRCYHHHLANLISQQFPLISVLGIMDPIWCNSLYLIRPPGWWKSPVSQCVLTGSPFHNSLCPSLIFHLSDMPIPILLQIS